MKKGEELRAVYAASLTARQSRTVKRIVDVYDELMKLAETHAGMCVDKVETSVYIADIFDIYQVTSEINNKLRDDLFRFISCKANTVNNRYLDIFFSLPLEDNT